MAVYYLKEKTLMTHYVEMLRRQLIPSIDMLQDVIEQNSDEMWTLSGVNIPIWQHVYHATAWLNAWARDWSTPYVKPEFHSNEARELDHGASPVITREQMREYLEKAREECMSFLDGLTDETVFAQEEAFGRTFTPADRIVGQISHVHYHIGVIHARIKQETGEFPKWE